MDFGYPLIRMVGDRHAWKSSTARAVMKKVGCQLFRRGMARLRCGGDRFAHVS